MFLLCFPLVSLLNVSTSVSLFRSVALIYTVIPKLQAASLLRNPFADYYYFSFAVQEAVTGIKKERQKEITMRQRAVYDPKLRVEGR